MFLSFCACWGRVLAGWGAPRNGPTPWNWRWSNRAWPWSLLLQSPSALLCYVSLSAPLLQQSLLTWTCGAPIPWICPFRAFDDDIPIRHHTLWDHEFVFGPLLTPCFCHLSLGGGPSSCGRRGCEVCYQWQPCALLHLAYSRRGVCGSPTLWSLPCVVRNSYLNGGSYLPWGSAAPDFFSRDLLYVMNAPLVGIAHLGGCRVVVAHLCYANSALVACLWSLCHRWWSMSWWLGLGLLRGLWETFH